MSKMNEYRKTLSKEEFFQRYKEGVEKSHQKAKVEYLVSKGLYILEECDKNVKGAMFDYNDNKYYLKVPIEINDDDFNSLKNKINMVSNVRFTNQTSEYHKVDMQWPTLLGFIILIVGIILAVLYPILGVVYLSSSVVLMTILFALGSILRTVKEISLRD